MDANLTQFLSNLQAQFVNGSVNSNMFSQCAILQPIITCLNKVADSIRELSDALSSLHQIIPKNVAPCPQKLQSYSYADATAKKSLPNSSNFCNNQISTPFVNNKENKNQQNEFMQELISLKNLRKDAFYKMLRNKLISNLYEENLKNEIKRIPKKFLPTITNHDSNEIKSHKFSIAIQNVINEIKTMKIHQNIQENKHKMLDTKIRDHIKKELNESERLKLTSDYEKIIARAFLKVEENINKKCIFLNSGSHMYTIKPFTIKQQNVQENQDFTNHATDEQRAQDTDSDEFDPDDFDFSPTSNNNIDNVTNTTQLLPSNSSTQDITRPRQQIESNTNPVLCLTSDNLTQQSTQGTTMSAPQPQRSTKSDALNLISSQPSFQKRIAQSKNFQTSKRKGKTKQKHIIQK